MLCIFSSEPILIWYTCKYSGSGNAAWHESRLICLPALITTYHEAIIVLKAADTSRNASLPTFFGFNCGRFNCRIARHIVHIQHNKRRRRQRIRKCIRMILCNNNRTVQFTKPDFFMQCTLNRCTSSANELREKQKYSSKRVHRDVKYPCQQIDCID